jgi:hypothetical protein
MKHVIAKITGEGNESVLVTERGVSFGYNDLVVDMRALPMLRELGYPSCSTSRTACSFQARRRRHCRTRAVHRAARVRRRGGRVDACSWKCMPSRSGEERRRQRPAPRSSRGAHSQAEANRRAARETLPRPGAART